ncbi:hypothetical protein Pla110_02850 [Polystyrenella longa]|uniref:Uncharacterized protein n=1 Tax=Polystyrenella longa TaxID=2528007 RepID=A0A518CH82_9PLAN|nr:hypothetical protein [Polystyrenella longa]QDU78581.1 hypothetical protein Pla110_02850 [Polystyrenella longa]
MSESLSIDLTKPQLDVLMRGLRYVRSSYMMEPAEPTEIVVNERTAKLAELTRLKDQLEKAIPSGEAAKV